MIKTSHELEKNTKYFLISLRISFSDIPAAADANGCSRKTAVCSLFGLMLRHQPKIYFLSFYSFFGIL